MDRTIPELIAAEFAGEELTPEERARLYRRRRRQRHWPYLLAGLSPAKFVAQMRADILRDLLHYTPRQARYRIRELLHLLSEFAAAWDGSTRRERTQATRGQEQAAAKKREKAGELRDAITKMKAEMQGGDDDVTKAQAARRYLRDHDPEWPVATAGQRDKKVDSLMRRLRRAKKKIGH